MGARRRRTGRTSRCAQQIRTSAVWKSALRGAPEPASTPPMTGASSHRTAGRTTTTGCRLAVVRVIRVIRGSFLPGFSTTDYTDYTDGRETWSDGANKSLRPADWKSALRRRRAPEPASTPPMTRASSDRTAGRTTTTGCRLAFIRVIRVIRGSFLPGFSTTDYTDYTDGRETASDRANKSLHPADQNVSGLEVCATRCARVGLHAADDQSQFTPDRRKDNHHRLPFGLYPCHPCHPWFISSWFLDHGLHGLHGWAGDGVGQGEQVAAPSRSERQRFGSLRYEVRPSRPSRRR
jgi:hypothetical protein